MTTKTRGITGSESRRRWYEQNIGLLNAVYGARNLSWDEAEFTWVMIRGFELPPNWTPRSTNLIVETPGIHGELEMGRINFYLDKGLKNRNGDTPGHYFEEEGSLNPQGGRGWAWYCLHVHSWIPTSDVLSGDSLLTAIDTIWQMMARQSS